MNKLLLTILLIIFISCDTRDQPDQVFKYKIYISHGQFWDVYYTQSFTYDGALLEFYCHKSGHDVSTGGDFTIEHIKPFD